MAGDRCPAGPGIAADEVREAVGRLLRSPDFAARVKLRANLTDVVEETPGGRA